MTSPVFTELLGSLSVLGIGLAALAALSIALTSLGIRLGTDDGSTIEALVVVLACNVLLLAPIAAVYAPAEAPLTLRSALAFGAAGVTGTLLGRLFYFTSISRIGSSRTEPIKATQPLHATIGAVVLFDERVTTLHLTGILLVVLGVAIVSWEMSRSDSATGVESVRALLPGLAAAVFFGIEPLLAKIGLGASNALISGVMLRIVVAAVAFLTYLRLRNSLPSPARLWRSNSRWYLFAGVANTSFLLSYYAALEVAPVSLVVPIVQTSPLVVMVLSLLFLPARLERVTWRLASGASIVVAGAVLVTLFS